MADVELVRRAQLMLGTIVEVAVDPAHQDAILLAFEAIRHVHSRMSFHEEVSDLALLRTAPAGSLVSVDVHTVAVLRIAQDLHHASGGLFDVSIGRQLVKTRFLPRTGIPHLGRFTGGTADIEIVDDRHVRCHRPMLIDLGGIAKGYAVDCAVEALQKAGAAHGIVNAGGDIRVFGKPAFPIHVRTANGGFAEPIILQECAIASSENSSNRKRVSGKTATPHIGPRRVPIVCDHVTSVIASRCVIADAMTKVAMIDADLADVILADYEGCVLRPAMKLAA
jgi:FAD:protein FMN transferase